MYREGSKISDIAGRTINPDGTIVELKKDAIFDRTIVKAGGVKVKAKSFAMPAVERGVIVEYRWREAKDYVSEYAQFDLQRDIPIQAVRYHVKPLKMEYSFSAITFHGNATPFAKEKDGFYLTTLANVPALRDEPRMPPDHEVRAWMLVYYTRRDKVSPDKYWQQFGKQIYDDNKSLMGVNDDVRRAAAAAIGDAATPDQKLERLFAFCRAKIKNTRSEASGLSREERAKAKENKSPADTLKRGAGTPRNINMLFGALAIAAGFDTRIARLADRGLNFFDPQAADEYFVPTYDIAVHVGDTWKFFDPGSPYIPYGMLRWEEEGLQALICDPKSSVFVKTPLSPSEKSKQRRIAALTLTEDGALEGDVRIEYTGHLAVEKRLDNEEDSPDKREETLRDMIKERMSTAELSAIHIENVSDPEKPFVYAFHVRVPGYAERTGKRLFIQPSFFKRGIAALFSASDRKYSIYFHYPWMEDDTVNIKLPAGFALDHAESPAPFAASTVAKYDVKIQVARGNEALIYNRTFSFAGLLFAQSDYAALKQVFDTLHERDNHTITLKQAGGTQ